MDRSLSGFEGGPRHLSISKHPTLSPQLLKVFQTNLIYISGILQKSSLHHNLTNLENSNHPTIQILKPGMKTLRTKTTELFNYFVLCFNRRKGSVLCLWIQVLTTMLKNCLFLRLESTCFYIFNLDCSNSHQHPQSMQF